LAFIQLNNIEVLMEGLTNIAKTVSANQDEEVWLELIYIEIVSTGTTSAQRCKMMKVAVHFSDSSWISSLQVPAA
jgi:hypothetical protein